MNRSVIWTRLTSVSYNSAFRAENRQRTKFSRGEARIPCFRKRYRLKLDSQISFRNSRQLGEHYTIPKRFACGSGDEGLRFRSNFGARGKS